MKTKLLIKLRKDAEERIGVFENNEDNKYAVVLDLRIIPDFGDYRKNSPHFQVLGTFNSTQEAINLCDYYRRELILKQVRKIRFKNSNRIY